MANFNEIKSLLTKEEIEELKARRVAAAMTRFELKQLVCNTLDVISYRIGLQYDGRNHVSEQVMTMLDCYNDNHILSEREEAIVNEWLSTYKASKA